MKIFSSEHVFSHPWETVVQAAVRKYPNPLNTGVLGVDVVDRHIDQTGVLHSHRLMTTRWGMPDWVKRIVGMPEKCYASEHSEVDPRNRTMRLRSQNLTMCKYLSINEELVYTTHPEDSDRTVLKQETMITVQGIPLTSYLEDLVVSTCHSNAQKGRQAMEWVIEKLKSETTAAIQGVESAFSNKEIL